MANYGPAMKRSLDMVVLVAVLGAFVVLNAVLFGRAARVARRTEVVPVPSTYRATESGCKALYTLLGRMNLRVDRLLVPWTHPLPEDATVLVVLDPAIYVRPLEARALREWIAAGGTAVLAVPGVREGLSPARELPRYLFLADPVRRAERIRRAAAADAVTRYLREGKLIWRVTEPNRYLAGVGSLRLDPEKSSVPPPEVVATAAAELTDDRREWPIAGDDPAWLCTLTRVGQGRLFFLPTAALFANGQLLSGDNATFVTNLIAGHARGGRVMFDEYHLGSAGGRNPYAVFWRPPLRWFVLQLLAALAVLLAGAAVRFGPARPSSAGEPRRRAVEFVTALAGMYRRAGAREAVARLWHDDLTRRLARAAGLPAGSEPDRLAERVAARAGLPADQVRAVLAGLETTGLSDQELLRCCREADTLLRRVERG